MHPDPNPETRDQSLTIGELAARSGVTTATIRFYEREGVMPPAHRSGTGRYRRYGRADELRLRFIRGARDLGFPLEDVRDLLSLANEEQHRSCATVEVVASKQLDRVRARLAQLKTLEAELDRLIRDCSSGSSIGDCRILQALEG